MAPSPTANIVKISNNPMSGRKTMTPDCGALGEFL